MLRLNSINGNKEQVVKKNGNIWHLLWHISSFVLLTVIVTLLVIYQRNLIDNQSIVNSFHYLFIALAALSKLLQELQQVNMFGVLRNILYPKSNFNKAMFIER